ncbi:MAG: tail fiber protein [Bacteroidota bacterium]
MNGYIGEIRMFGGNFAPRSWAFCYGQLLSIAQNTALFSIIGTIYGGDGRTTFALPDLRGRIPYSTGNGPGLPSVRMGQRGGTETNTMTILTMPSHSHLIQVTKAEVKLPVSIAAADENSPNEAFLTTQTNEFYSSAATAGQFYGPGSTISNLSLTDTPTGSQQSYNDMAPVLALNYIICLQGIFPSRN